MNHKTTTTISPLFLLMKMMLPMTIVFVSIFQSVILLALPAIINNKRSPQQQQLTLKNKKARIIIKQQHKPTTMLFSSLFSSLKNEEPQNNKPSSSSAVTHEDDVTDDDRVCLHFSVGDLSCPTCDYQQQLTTNNKRKRPQQQLQPTNLHETHFAKTQKHVHQDNNTVNAAVVVPVARNWGYSTALVLYDDPWKIKKVLTKTDLGSNCYILIKRELAKDLIFPFLGGLQVCEKRDIHVRVWNIDTKSLHSLVFTVHLPIKATFSKTHGSSISYFEETYRSEMKSN